MGPYWISPVRLHKVDLLDFLDPELLSDLSQIEQDIAILEFWLTIIREDLWCFEGTICF